MEEGAKDDEDMPDAMIETVLVVVHEEIHTARVGDTFGQNKEEREGGDALTDRLDHEEDGPS